MPIAKYRLVALDCPDPRGLAEFYQRIVGGRIKQETDADHWVRLELDDASDIAFQRDDNYRAPQWPDGLPQQAHLDLEVTDLDAAEREVLAVGATKASIQPTPDEWRVFLDPAGHPFCLVVI